jgi:hypothetical protein
LAPHEPPAQQGSAAPPQCWQVSLPPQMKSVVAQVRLAQQGWLGPPHATH